MTTTVFVKSIFVDEIWTLQNISNCGVVQTVSITPMATAQKTQTITCISTDGNAVGTHIQSEYKHIKTKWMRGRTDAVFIYLLLIQYSAACHTLPPLGVKVCWHRIGILLQAQLCGVNIYRGDWHEVIRSRGPFMITHRNLNRIFNQALVCISGTITFQSF